MKIGWPCVLQKKKRNLRTIFIIFTYAHIQKIQVKSLRITRKQKIFDGIFPFVAVLGCLCVLLKDLSSILFSSLHSDKISHPHSLGHTLKNVDYLLFLGVFDSLWLLGCFNMTFNKIPTIFVNMFNTCTKTSCRFQKSIGTACFVPRFLRRISWCNNFNFENDIPGANSRKLVANLLSSLFF